MVAHKVVRVNLVVNDRRVLGIGEQHQAGVVVDINDGKCTGPASVANGFSVCNWREGPLVANVTLTPPAQAVGDVGVLWLDELVVNILAEEHGIAVATTVHNSLDKNGQVGSVCKQTSVTRDSTHGVVGLLVMDRALNGIGAHVVKGNQSVTSVAVKLGSCDSVSLEAVVQWVKRDVLESQWLVKSFLNVLVKALIGDLLDNKTKQHVVYVGIGSLGAWDVLQRGLDDLLQNLVAILGVQLLVCVWLRIVRLLWVVVAVVILRIWWESSLVL